MVSRSKRWVEEIGRRLKAVRERFGQKAKAGMSVQKPTMRTTQDVRSEKGAGKPRLCWFPKS
jgi:hypothetical protein